MQKKSSFQNPLIRWFDERLPIFSLMHKEYGAFPTPKNFNYFWSFGAIAMFILGLMIVTGILLAMHYVPNTELAFNAVERLTRDVNDGWMLRYLHMNGAHMFFLVVYIHIFRGLYYGSYKSPREVLWGFGVILLVLMMATAFMGYVLPWSQMSGWGATVITSLFSAFPVIGDGLVTWLWGGFSVDNPTLNRFFALHFLLPFIICGVVFLHVWALHICGSNNPTGVEPKTAKDTVPFHPFYTVKDFFALGVFLIIFTYLVFFAPDSLGHPDHYAPFNHLVTPPHIVPEWYFLPFYAILRSITFDIFFLEAKLLGVIAMFAAVGILLLLPWLDRSPVRSARYRPLYRQFFWILVLACVVLGYAGSQPATDFGPALAGKIATAYYFIHFLVILPLLGKFEKTLPLPESIHAATLVKSDQQS